MKQLVQWGAGNIGRSFIGQVFARSGYAVVFIDIDAKLIDLLNKGGWYDVLVISQKGETRLHITGVRAVHGSEQQRINEAAASADLLSVSVGKPVLSKIAPQMAEAVLYRYQRRPNDPLNIIIAENLHGGAQFLEKLLVPHLPEDFPFTNYVGLVETSIGKMVPIQTGDPLEVASEPYNTLIVDQDGFIGKIPECEFMQPVSPIEAYVERKLFIHNLGHAAASYYGFQAHRDASLLAEVVEDDDVRDATRRAMEQAADILAARHPGVFARDALSEHIEDLLYRFQNRALGDTIYRIGRDLKRKLRYDDRVMGGVIAAEELGLPWDELGKVFIAGLSFKAADPDGKLYPGDERLLEEMSDMTLEEKIRYAAAFDEGGIASDIQQRIVAGIQGLSKDILS